MVMRRAQPCSRFRWRSMTQSARASPMRNSSLRSGAFSKRDNVGCEAKSSPLTGSRPTNSLCTGSQARRAASLACDPVHKLLVGRDPVKGEDLASQPTLSRFENAPDRKELFRMGEALADCVIERHRKRLHGCARRITMDLDPTDDPTHGQQQFTFFNSHYDSYCYLPMVCFLT